MSTAITQSGPFDAPRSIERWNAGLGAGAVAASLAFGAPHFALSLAVGALLEAFNFRGLATHALATFAGAQAQSLEAIERDAEATDFADQTTGRIERVPQPSGRLIGIFSFRFLLTIGGMFYALWLGAHPIGLVLGISLIVPAAVIGAWMHRPQVQPVDAQMVLAPDDPSWDRWSVWRAGEVEPRSEDDE